MYTRAFFSEFTIGAEAAQHRNIDTRSYCGDFELNARECLEAYGNVRGQRYCRDYIDDWNECGQHFKQLRRLYLIRNERFKKYVKGELKTYWEPEPHRNSFIDPPFTI